jgi:hypothetical protein
MAGFGGLEGVKHIHQHGYIDSFSSGEGWRQIWDGPGYQAYNTTKNATTEVFVASTNATDNTSGVGARVVCAEGLDTAGYYKMVMADMNGQTPVSIGTDWLYIQHLCVHEAGSSGKHAGSIYAGTGVWSSGVPATKWSMMYDGDNTSQSSLVFVPKGYTGYLLFSAACSARSSTVYVTFRMRAFDFSGSSPMPAETHDKFVVTQNMSNRTTGTPEAFPELTGLYAEGKASGNGVDACTMVVLLLVENEADGTPQMEEVDYLTAP